MKPLIVISFLFFGSMAFAAPEASSVNEKALEILFSNSGQLTSQEGKKVSAVLAQTMLTSEKTNNKVSNSCAYDSGDDVFKCSLSIFNKDDQQLNAEESLVVIRYQLEKAVNGLPSEKLFYLSVEVSYVD